MNNSQKYSDIINLPHYISKKHKSMSIDVRAAQFAPFAALNGFESNIEETSRYTDEKIEIDEQQKKILDFKLKKIKECFENKPVVSVTYFVPDISKSGGRYISKKGIINKIDEYRNNIVLEKEIIHVSDIIDIEILND